MLGILGENEIFGEMGLIDGQPRSATARAREDSVVYVLTPKTFDTRSSAGGFVATITPNHKIIEG